MNEASEHRPTVAIVDLSAIRHNLHYFLAKMTSEQQLYVAVKANAYGHGLVPIAQAAIEYGAHGLLVATIDEGITLRKNGITAPILVLGISDARGIAEMLLYDLTITVSDANFFERAEQQLQATGQAALLTPQSLKIHLALDTGMGRIGLQTEAEVAHFVQVAQKVSWIDWQGVFTHFATAGGGPETHVAHQWERWLELTACVPDQVTIRHYANSAMGMWYPYEPQSSIVRLGIGLYGMHPKDEWQTPDALDLRPALQLVSEIVHIKKVSKGTKISYGATYEAQEDEWIATIPIGYADGWFRRYQQIPVLVDGKACQVAGRINMDQLMIRLPNFYPVGTTVTLIGQDKTLCNHASDIAQQVDTISYEIFTSIAPRVPRIYLKGEQEQ
ncbi:MAG: alanine racemase [Aerococcaceae bacterium]|nr:alanine racemase [Aerococcaceae bacterium]